MTVQMHLFFSGSLSAVYGDHDECAEPQHRQHHEQCRNIVAGHVEHDTAPPTEYVPLEHCPLTVDNPAFAQYEPAGHGVAPAVSPEHIEPAGHSLHVLTV